MHFDDGTQVVITFNTKSALAVNKPASPRFTISITPPDKETLRYGALFPMSEASFSTKKFDVKMGKSYGYGNLQQYVLHLEIPQASVAVDLTLDRVIPSWRPGNGHLYFEKDKSKFFAWLPSVPKGNIYGTLSYAGLTQNVTGTGYHDHNWGNTNMDSLMSSWWWSRSYVGDKVIIASEIIARPEYASYKTPIFLVANETTVIADSTFKGATLELEENDIKKHPDPSSIEKIAHQLSWEYESGDDEVELELTMKKLLQSTDILLASGKTKEEIERARRAGLTPWYTRFSGSAEISINADDVDSNNSGNVGVSVFEKMDFE